MLELQADRRQGHNSVPVVPLQFHHDHLPPLSLTRYHFSVDKESQNHQGKCVRLCVANETLSNVSISIHLNMVRWDKEPAVWVMVSTEKPPRFLITPYMTGRPFRSCCFSTPGEFVFSESQCFPFISVAYSHLLKCRRKMPTFMLFLESRTVT